MAHQTLAETYCDRTGLSFEDSFRRQFRIVVSGNYCPDYFQTETLAGWDLQYCPKLPLTDLLDKKGQRVGICIGYAVDAAGARLAQKYKFDFDADQADFWTLAEDTIAWFAGRYTVLLATGQGARIIGDLAGHSPTVYNPIAKVIAASPLLALDREIIPNPDYDSVAVTGVPDLKNVSLETELLPSKGIFSFGHTVDRDVKRLTPNFTLDLESFQETRFWPRPETDFGAFAENEDHAAELIANRLAQVCNALIGKDQAWISLSGGLDSRMLLAVAESGFSRKTHLYTHAMNWATYMDSQSAKLLAEHLGRDIRIIMPEKGYRKNHALNSPEEQDEHELKHLISAGFCGRINDQIRRGSFDWIPQDDLMIRGNFLEIVTARSWPLVGGYEQTNQLEYAVERSRVACSDDAEKAKRMKQMRDWADRLPDIAKPLLHDFSYMETTLANTQAGFLSTNHMTYLGPACDRYIFALSMGVDFPVRRSGDFYCKILEQSRPDFLAVPTANELVKQARQAKQKNR